MQLFPKTAGDWVGRRSRVRLAESAAALVVGFAAALLFSAVVSWWISAKLDRAELYGQIHGGLLWGTLAFGGLLAAGASLFYWQRNRQSQTVAELRRLETQLRVSRARGSEGVKEFLDRALQEVIDLSESRLGYIYFYDEAKQEFTLNTWSREAMAECRVVEPQTLYQLAKTGLWGEVVRQRRPLIVNDYRAANPLKRGCPEGHAPLRRWMSVPVFRDEEIVAVVGLANKEEPYEELDLRQAELLMNAVWKVVDGLEAQKERCGMIEELGRKNREIEEFVYITTHDLRTPLVNISGFTQVVRETLRDELVADNKKSTELGDALEFISSSAKKMDALLTGLLRLSRLGRDELNPVLVDMDALVDNAGRTLRYQLDELGVALRVDPLPDCIGDAEQLGQVFTNLLANALKYRDPSRPLAIEVSGEQHNGRVRYRVRDNGLGIAAEHLERIWQVFYRAVPHSGPPGDGVGLAVVRRVVERHQGRAWVESELNRGTTFHIELPGSGRTEGGEHG